MKQLSKMKALHKKPLVFLLAILLAAGPAARSQNEKNEEVLVTCRYFASNNRFQYLMVQTKLKSANRLQALPGVVLKLFLDENRPENLITKVRTDEKGEAKALIPVSLQKVWEASPSHKFLAVVEATSAEEETTTQLDITRGKLVLDTINEEGQRKVRVTALALDSGSWKPEKGVELKIGVRRLGGDIRIGEEESYTTDSLGQVTGDFKIDRLPAVDTRGDILLVARTEDNEKFGNLSEEKNVPWGVYLQRTDQFNKRSLWATRDKTPLWLLFMAYSIMATVWAVILYLVFQLWKIRKLGREQTASVEAEKIPKEAFLIE